MWSDWGGEYKALPPQRIDTYKIDEAPQFWLYAFFY